MRASATDCNAGCAKPVRSVARGRLPFGAENGSVVSCNGSVATTLRRWLVFAALGARLAIAANENADPSFGRGGQLLILRPPHTPTVSAPTGDIVALADGGYFGTMANEDGSVWIGRAARDGTCELSFGER
jgi:hypothetical protein